jgi:hypothetical protein
MSINGLEVKKGVQPFGLCLLRLEAQNPIFRLPLEERGRDLAHYASLMVPYGSVIYEQSRHQSYGFPAFAGDDDVGVR